MNARGLLNTTWNYAKAAVTRGAGGTSRTKLADSLVAVDPTAGYRSNPFYGTSTVVNKLPPYTLYAGKMMMEVDPVIEFANNVRNAALMAADVEVVARSPVVQAWVKKQWSTIWESNRRQIVATKKWGFAGVQPTYKRCKQTGLIDIDQLKDFAPEDVRALESNGKPCGFRVKDRKLFGPRAMWLTFQAEYGSPYGRGTLRRMYPPWYEKWMEHGAKKLTQMTMIKNAIIGDIYWVPFNLSVEMPDGTQIPWRDIARGMGENRLSGGVQVLPNMLNDKGEKLVDYTPPSKGADATHVFEWLEHLDEDILRGADIPIETVKAGETGSGYSGRSIPFMVLLSTCSSEIVDYVKAIESTLRTVAWLNWGDDPEFEMKPKSLVESFAGDAQGSAMGGGAIGGQPGQGGMQRPLAQQQPQQMSGMQQRPQGGQQTTRFDLSDNTTSLDEITAIGTAAARRRILTASERIGALKKKTDLSIEGLGKFELLGEIRAIIEDLHRGISSDLQASMVTAGFTGAAEVVVALPPVLAPTLPGVPPAPPAEPPSISTFFPDDDQPNVQFPVLDEAIQVLHDADVFTSDDYRAVAEAAREGTFAITSTLGEEAVAEIRDLLAENLKKGPDLEAFVDAVQERLQEGSPLSERHIETIFRTNVSSSFSNGANKSLEQPMVVDAFPYRAYWPTTDQRARHSHRELKKLGLNGTNIYRADDPTWKKFRPPWDYNCRCSWSPVTVEQAAREGVIEAQEWMVRAKHAAEVNGGRWPEWLSRTAPSSQAWVTPPAFEPPAEFRRI